MSDQPAGIGDVNSNERGSGARYNNGKPPFELIPLRILAQSLERKYGPSRWTDALDDLGVFQESRNRVALYRALATMGLDGWPECASVFDYGRKKYKEWNWAKGMPWSVPLACAARHLKSLIEGEQNDEDKPDQPGSKLPHRGHTYCNVVMLLHYIDFFPEGDDLPPRELFERKIDNQETSTC
jgi:hypothetical protein